MNLSQSCESVLNRLLCALMQGTKHRSDFRPACYSCFFWNFFVFATFHVLEFYKLIMCAHYYYLCRIFYRAKLIWNRF
jgi:hypothetical protein